MTTKSWCKKLVAMLAALLLLAVFFTATATAASANTTAVLERLQTLQRADINPAWLPDIEKNQPYVQALLDLYLACTDEEKLEFTEQQNTDLRSYFEALYQVQGKTTAEVDKIFAAGQETSSQPSSVPASTPDASAAGTSSSASASAAVQSSTPAKQGGTSVTANVPNAPASMPSITSPPQISKDEGWLALFGNRALGTIIQGILLLMALLVFVRFLAALRRAGKVSKSEFNRDQRAQELFGEHYESLPEPAATSTETKTNNTPRQKTEEKSLLSWKQRGKAWKRDHQPAATADSDAITDEENGIIAPSIPTASQLSPSAETSGAGNEADAQPNSPPTSKPAELIEPSDPDKTSDVKRAALADKPEEKPDIDDVKLTDKINDTDTPAPDADITAEPETPAAKKDTAPPLAADKNNPATEESTLPIAENEKEKPVPPPTIGLNPDRPNSITLRSFNTPVRNGRPTKMTFRQGSPEDLDAIDE